MSQPISLPNVGGININGAATYTSDPDQFSPPKHHYPLAGSPQEAAAGFGNARRGSNVVSASPTTGLMSTSPRQTSGFSFSSMAESAANAIAGAVASPKSPSNLTGKSPRQRSTSYVAPVVPKVLTPFVPKIHEEDEKLQPKVLLLENVNESAIEMFRAQGYIIETEKFALGEDELIARVNRGGYSALGIRSKTKVTAKVIESCKNLIVIGCFCIGTNQVDLLTAAKNGIAVFNSPFSNSRSVAELVISEIVALSRQLCDRSAEMHQGIWNKVSKGCWEIRGKTLGIVGYGHIGAQLSVLAEAMGMQVRYFDVVPMMPLGSAQQIDTLDDLLAVSDFVTLHVPELPETFDMIGAEELSKMKKGSYLINNARGKVVDLPALVDSLKSGHLAGAAIDVYPKEPAANGKNFDDNLNAFHSGLASCNNVILTPHIGGSTEEAQKAIGAEVSSALVRYISYGSSLNACNYPSVSLKVIPPNENLVRLCYSHVNKRGALQDMNSVLGNFNVERQLSDSKGDTAYCIADISEVSITDVQMIYEKISALPANISTRILY